MGSSSRLNKGRDNGGGGGTIRSDMSGKCGVGGGGSFDKSKLKLRSCSLEGHEREFLFVLDGGTGGNFFLDGGNGGGRIGTDFSGLAVGRT